MSTIPRYEWQPTTEEIATRAGIPPSDVERMDQNTSPFGTEWTLDVMTRSAARLNDYPAATYHELRTAVAASTGLAPENVVPGAGADELILLAARAFLGAGAVAVIPTPTYSLYEIASRQVDARIVTVPCPTPHFELATAEVVRAARDAALVWLCVPSNPIGNRPANTDIDAIVAATDGVVVLDAAYAEFPGDTWTEALDRHHNLLVLHTMSKAYGLAAIRVGYALGHPDLIAAIDAIRPPGSLATVSAELAVAALNAPERMKEIVAATNRERDHLDDRLRQLGLRPLPSLTNFVLCEIGPTAHAIEAALMDQGLVVRKYPAGSALADYLRFTVRSPRAHDRLITALESLLRSYP